MKRVKEFYDKYERRFSSFALVAGFIVDYLTLKRIDLFIDNFFIILYLIFVGFSITIINLYEAGRLRNKFVENIYEFLPSLMQFAVGGLFSAFVVFYSKSASLLTSGAFVLILAALLIGNEFFKTRYVKLVFQVGIYFVTLFSFSIYFLPLMIKHMGAWVFLLSGLISLVLIGLFVQLIAYLVPTRYKESERLLVFTIGGLYLAINFLYFTNIIPPIPLSLKQGEVYYFVERVGTDYKVIGEKKKWYESIPLLTSEIITLKAGAPLYAFSSVFAPADLNTRIIHDWQFYDEKTNGWKSVTEVPFLIMGGRSEGYRGFSKKESLFEGKWRVDVKTERGQIIGRVRFNIETGTSENLEEKII